MAANAEGAFQDLCQHLQIVPVAIGVVEDLRGDHSGTPADVSVVGLLHSASERRQLPCRKQDEHHSDGNQDNDY